MLKNTPLSKDPNETAISDQPTSDPENPPMKIIARIRSDFPEKFGIPRQSGLVDALKAAIVFEPAYRNPDALRGLENFSHIWLIWGFSQSVRDQYSPTVRPPRLGGSKRMGVFATRSPFRPNPIGLSSVQIDRIENHPQLGPVIHVSGADLLDQTPIYDIKPYLAYTDSHPEATGGFSDPVSDYILAVDFPAALLQLIPREHQSALMGVLAHDPRPSYQTDPLRIYGLAFNRFNIRFTVQDGVLTVCQVTAI